MINYGIVSKNKLPFKQELELCALMKEGLNDFIEVVPVLLKIPWLFILNVTLSVWSYLVLVTVKN